ncbi:MAG: hypothetical protein AAF267_24820 [Deinococcota bacterium]
MTPNLTLTKFTDWLEYITTNPNKPTIFISQHAITAVYSQGNVCDYPLRLTSVADTLLHCENQEMNVETMFTMLNAHEACRDLVSQLEKGYGTASVTFKVFEDIIEALKLNNTRVSYNSYPMCYQRPAPKLVPVDEFADDMWLDTEIYVIARKVAKIQHASAWTDPKVYHGYVPQARATALPEVGYEPQTT